MATTKVIPGVLDLNSATSDKGLKMPSGTELNRPTDATGQIRNNTNESSSNSASCMEYYNGADWKKITSKPLVPPLDVTGYTLDATKSTTISGINSTGLAFNNDGSKMWTGNSVLNNNKVAEYNLSTNFDPSTYSFVTDLAIGGMNYVQFVYHTGNYLFAGGYNNGGSAASLHRFELSGGSISGSTQTTGTGITNFTNNFNLNDTGDKFIVNNGSSTVLSIYSLSTPFDITSTITSIGTVNLSSYLEPSINYVDGQFTSDGTQFVFNQTIAAFPGSTCYISVLNCSTPYDLTTITSRSSITSDLNPSVNQPYTVVPNPGNTEVYCTNQFASDIYVFN